MSDWYDKYKPLNTFWDKIYQECNNTEFRKAGIWPLSHVRKYDLTLKLKYYCFNRGHNHNKDNYIQVKDAIEALIKKGPTYIAGITDDAPRAGLPSKGTIKS